MCVTYCADHGCPTAAVRGVITSSHVMNSCSFCTLLKTLYLRSVTPSMTEPLHPQETGGILMKKCRRLHALLFRTWPPWELPALIKYFEGQSWFSAKILGKVLFTLRCRDCTAVMTGEVVSWRFLSKLDLWFNTFNKLDAVREKTIVFFIYSFVFKYLEATEMAPKVFGYGHPSIWFAHSLT